MDIAMEGGINSEALVEQLMQELEILKRKLQRKERMLLKVKNYESPKPDISKNSHKDVINVEHSKPNIIHPKLTNHSKSIDKNEELKSANLNVDFKDSESHTDCKILSDNVRRSSRILDKKLNMEAIEICLKSDIQESTRFFPKLPPDISIPNLHFSLPQSQFPSIDPAFSQSAVFPDVPSKFLKQEINSFSLSNSFFEPKRNVEESAVDDVKDGRKGFVLKRCHKVSDDPVIDSLAISLPNNNILLIVATSTVLSVLKLDTKTANFKLVDSSTLNVNETFVNIVETKSHHVATLIVDGQNNYILRLHIVDDLSCSWNVASLAIFSDMAELGCEHVIGIRELPSYSTPTYMCLMGTNNRTEYFKLDVNKGQTKFPVLEEQWTSCCIIEGLPSMVVLISQQKNFYIWNHESMKLHRRWAIPTEFEMKVVWNVSHDQGLLFVAFSSETSAFEIAIVNPVNGLFLSVFKAKESPDFHSRPLTLKLSENLVMQISSSKLRIWDILQSCASHELNIEHGDRSANVVAASLKDYYFIMVTRNGNVHNYKFNS